MIKRVSLPVLVFVLLISCGVEALTSTGSSAAGRQAERKQIVLRGRAVCVEPSGRIVPDHEDCSVDTVKFLFHCKDGGTYAFVPEDALTAMFTDHRVRERELQITAWERQNHQLELVGVQSLKNGKLYDLYYYCDICNITAYGPGPCPCCRRDLEFKETPAPAPEP